MQSAEESISMAERNIVREIIQIKIAKVKIARIREDAVHKISMEKARIMWSKVKIAKDRLDMSKTQLGTKLSCHIPSTYNIPPTEDNVREQLMCHVQNLLSLPTAKSLTPILTLSEDYLRSESLWENTIRLSHMIREKASVSYDRKPIVGDNLHCMNTSNIMDLSIIPSQFLLMLGNLDDWKVNGKLPEDIVPYSLSNNLGHDEYVLVMLASNKSKRVMKKAHWSDEYVHKFNPLFNTTVIGNGKKHHGSVGKYLGMGTTAKYTKRGMVSYGKIVGKCYNDHVRRDICEGRIKKDIQKFSNELNSVIEGIVKGGQCVTQALSDVSHVIGMKSDKFKCFNEGMVCAYICNNAQTHDNHIEKDCSYTMIGAPIGKDRINLKGKFVFEFEWNKDGGIIRVKLRPGTVLYYSGYAIMHRQTSLVDNGNQYCDFKFWNLATYGNKRIYENAIQSFKRVINSR